MNGLNVQMKKIYTDMFITVGKWIKLLKIIKTIAAGDNPHTKKKFKFILKPINEVTPHDLVGYRKERLFKVKTSTYVREMNIIQHIFSISFNTFGILGEF